MITDSKKLPVPTSLSSGRQLLDPKNFVKGSQQAQSPNQTQEEEKDAQALEAEQGLATYIERLHGVKDRSERPVKRQKIQDEAEAGKKAQEVNIRSGGDLGQYVRDKQKEGAQEAMADGIVDLTNGDEDDELVVVGEQKIVVREICYGRIDKTKVQAWSIPHVPLKGVVHHTASWPGMKVKFKRFPSKDIDIRVLDTEGFDFGRVDVRTAAGLAPVMDRKELKIRTQARLNSRPRGPYEIPGQSISKYFDMTVK